MSKDPPRFVPTELKRCPWCGYSLLGTMDAGLYRCPECGCPFTEAMLLPRPNRVPWRQRLDQIVFAVAVSAAVFVAVVFLAIASRWMF